jgi:hypothetical protein
MILNIFLSKYPGICEIIEHLILAVISGSEAIRAIRRCAEITRFLQSVMGFVKTK